jgi:hypothetical protein
MTGMYIMWLSWGWSSDSDCVRRVWKNLLDFESGLRPSGFSGSCLGLHLGWLSYSCADLFGWEECGWWRTDVFPVLWSFLIYFNTINYLIFWCACERLKGSSIFFLVNFVWCCQSLDHPYKDLAKLGSNKYMKANSLEHCDILLATYWSFILKSGNSYF